MEKWSVLTAVVVAVLAALPNILLYADNRKYKFNLALGVLTIIIGLAIAFYNLFIFASEEQNVNLFTFCPSEAKRSEYSAACGGIKRRSRLLIPRGLPRGGFIYVSPG